LRGQRVVLTLVDGEDKTVQCVSDAGIFIPSRKVVAQLSLHHHKVSMVPRSIHFPVFNRSGPAWMLAPDVSGVICPAIPTTRILAVG
jgi:hypothetical protein